VSRCQRTLRGEGHSAVGWGIGGSVWLQTVRSKVHSLGQLAAATCAAPLLSPLFARVSLYVAVYKCRDL